MPNRRNPEARFYTYTHECASMDEAKYGGRPVEWKDGSAQWVLADLDYGDDIIAYCPYCGEKLADPREPVSPSEPPFKCCECGGTFPHTERRKLVANQATGWMALAPLCPACLAKIQSEGNP